MSIQVADKIIGTVEEGHLTDLNDWSEEFTAAMAAQQSQQDHVELSETQLELTQFFRDYFAQNKVYPTMHKLVLTLGRDHGQRCGLERGWAGLGAPGVKHAVF